MEYGSATAYHDVIARSTLRELVSSESSML